MVKHSDTIYRLNSQLSSMCGHVSRSMKRKAAPGIPGHPGPDMHVNRPQSVKLPSRPEGYHGYPPLGRRSTIKQEPKV